MNSADPIVAVFGAYSNRIAVALLVFARVLPAVSLCPLLGGMRIPQRARIGIGLAISAFILPLSPSAVSPTPGALNILIIKEILIGTVIGFVASLAFQAALSAGRIVDLARGTNEASLLVPQIEAQAFPLADLQFQLAIVYALATGLHLLFVQTLVMSFVAIPLGVLPRGASLAEAVDRLAGLSGQVVALGLLLAAPAVVVLFLVDVTLGIINRFSPQLPVFFMAMPIKAAVGILVVALGLGLGVTVIARAFIDNVHVLDRLLLFLR